MSVRLIGIDIDGTLLDSQWRLSQANACAIAEAASRGIEVALVTGRRFDFALPIARQLDCPLTMIVNNGALIRMPDGTTHVRHLLLRDVAGKVLEAARPWRDNAAVVFDRPLENQVILERIDWDDPIRGGYYARNRSHLAVVTPLESCLTEDPIQVMFTGSLAAMAEAERALRSVEFHDRFSLAVTTYESRNFAMIDVLNPACSRGAALAEWARLRGYVREEVMAIGDNHNDREMLSFAGVPVIMGNAVPELKLQGWHETRSNDDDGVAAAIDTFVFQAAMPCA